MFMVRALTVAVAFLCTTPALAIDPSRFREVELGLEIEIIEAIEIIEGDIIRTDGETRLQCERRCGGIRSTCYLSAHLGHLECFGYIVEQVRLGQVVDVAAEADRCQEDRNRGELTCDQDFVSCHQECQGLPSR